MKIKPLFIPILLSLTLLFASLPVKASDVTIWVDPQYNYYGVGEIFTVNVKLADVEHLYAWQVALVFNASVLNALNATYASDNIFDGQEVVVVDPIINNAEGYVLHGACLLDGISNDVSGSGGLAQITFIVVGPGQSTLKIEREGEGDIVGGFGTLLLDRWCNDIAFTSYDGYHHNHLQGDITGPNGKFDAIVSMLDILKVVKAFGSTPGKPNWDLNADVNHDGQVDMSDVKVETSNFGHHWP
jgi:hypothetical protein